MPKNSCTPDNVIGSMLASGESSGLAVNENVMKAVNKEGQQVYHQAAAKGQAEVLETASKTVSDSVETLVTKETGEQSLSTLQKIKGGVSHTMKPSDIFPKELTEPVFKLIDDFLVNTSDPFKDLKLFKDSMSKAASELEPVIAKMPAELQGEARFWLKDLANGYPFSMYQQGNIITQGINNIVSNAIDMSGTILAGNPFELMVKLPTVYGVRGTFKTVGQTLKQTKGNLWMRLPELEKRGFYGWDHSGIDFAKKNGGFWGWYKNFQDGLMAVSDRPLKNIAFIAGQTKTGTAAGGMEAIEKIAFQNRIGNDPRMTRNAASKSALTFLNYTLNTYGLLGSYTKGLTNPKTAVDSARALATFAGMTTILGGGVAAFVPELLMEGLKKYDPDLADWENENINAIGKLVRPGGITSVGISAQMADRSIKRFYSSMNKAAEALGEDEYQQAAMEMADAGLSIASFWRNPLGNPRVQGVLRNARDLAEGEINEEEFVQKTKEKFMPILKED